MHVIRTRYWTQICARNGELLLLWDNMRHIHKRNTYRHTHKDTFAVTERWDIRNWLTHRHTKIRQSDTELFSLSLSLFRVPTLRFGTRWIKFHATRSQPVNDHEWEILWFSRQFAVTNTSIDNYRLIHWNRNTGILQKMTCWRANTGDPFVSCYRNKSFTTTDTWQDNDVRAVRD
jgi:hypothetical protein